MSTFTTYRVEDHEAFIFNSLLPLIINYARASNTPPEVVAMASFLSLATILQTKGMSRASLMQCIDGARLSTPLEAPEGLH